MKKQFLVIIFFFLAFSCKKDNNQNIPDVFVDIFINLDLPSFSDLNFVSNWAYVTGGSRGIILYRASNEEFVALDRHCTYNVAARDIVTVDNDNNIIATDTDGCMSQFSIVDGAVLHDPASIPLKRYNTTFDQNSNVVRIFN